MLKETDHSIYGVERHIKATKAFLAAGDHYSLRYACLELRLAIEVIVYKKLLQLREKIPPNVYRTWQPNKAIKFLLSFEPRADLDNTIEIEVSENPGQPKNRTIKIGDYRMFSSKWLNTNYNKISKFLHAEAHNEKGKARSEDKIKRVVEEVLSEVERVASATMIVTINSISNFECEYCHKTVYCSSHQIEQNSIIECFHERCAAIYRVRPGESENIFITESESSNHFKCKKCTSINAIKPNLPLTPQKCWECNQEHVFKIMYADRQSDQQTSENPTE